MYEGEVMWVLPNYVKETLTNALNSPMCTEDRLLPFSAPMRNKEPRSLKLLRSYEEVINYLLRKYEIGKAIAEKNAMILLYVKSHYMTPQQYAEALIGKYLKFADMNDEGNLNDFSSKVYMSPSGAAYTTKGRKKNKLT